MRRLFLTPAVVVALSIVLGAQANTVKDVEAVEHARMVAVELRDAEAVAKFLTDDFTSIATSGRRSTKQQYLDGLRANPAPVKMLHEEVQIRVYHDTAIITGRSTVTRAADGAQVGLTRYTHVYVKQGQQWKLAAMHNSTIAPAQ
jgi:uncharacterized protein (TIGR02246 family)